MFADLLSNVAGSVAETGSKACFFVLVDEPECPESLLK